MVYNWKRLAFFDIDFQLSVERYACHLYTEVLRKLPAVVRKWWNTSQSRQKNFVDNLTTNYVSSLICSEELKAIANRKEKHENMQVSCDGLVFFSDLQSFAAALHLPLVLDVHAEHKDHSNASQ